MGKSGLLIAFGVEGDEGNEISSHCINPVFSGTPLLPAFGIGRVGCVLRGTLTSATGAAN